MCIFWITSLRWVFSAAAVVDDDHVMVGATERMLFIPRHFFLGFSCIRLRQGRSIPFTVFFIPALWIFPVLLMRGLLDLFSFIYLLKLYLPLVHKIAIANKLQLYHKVSLHIKYAQSISPISPIFWILFLNSNNKSLDVTTAGRLFHIIEPRKWIGFVR